MTRIIASLLCCCWFLGLADVAVSQWTGCRDPNDGNVKVGERTPICLTVGPGGSWSEGVPYIRWMFHPKADDYSRFNIEGSYRDLISSPADGLKLTTDKNMTVHSASQMPLSWLRVYWDAENQYVFPYLTSIVDVKNGVVQGIAWDDACVFCSKGRCVENTFDFDGNSASEREANAPSKGCYFTKAECDKIATDPSRDSSSEFICDLTLYVVWTGTDVDGREFLSSSSRFSNFPAQRLQDRLSQNLPDLPSFGGNPFG